MALFAYTKSIKAFACNHGVQLDTGRYFNEGMKRLREDMDEHVFKGCRPLPQHPVRFDKVYIKMISFRYLMSKEDF